METIDLKHAQQLTLDFCSKYNLSPKTTLGIDFNSVSSGIVCANSSGSIYRVFYRYSDDPEKRETIRKKLERNKKIRSRSLSKKRTRCQKAQPLIKINMYTSNRYRNFLGNIAKKSYRDAMYKQNDSRRIANKVIALCKEKGINTIVLEDINFQHMQKFNGKMIEGNNWGQLRACIEKKAKRANIEAIRVPRFFPSTQKCSQCGYILEREMKLKIRQRIYKCPKCKAKMDRDKNAAQNLAAYPEKFEKQNE